MDKLNRDVMYLICKKLNIRSILNLSTVNKTLRQKIIFHEYILKQQNPFLQVVRISLQGMLKYGSSFAIPLPSKENFREKKAESWAMEILTKTLINGYFINNM
jgi:hypothetical protein